MFCPPAAISIVPADNYNDNVCVRFDNDGKLFYSSRFIIEHSCPMTLSFFPFDKHSCVVSPLSYLCGCLPTLTSWGGCSLLPVRGQLKLRASKTLTHHRSITTLSNLLRPRVLSQITELVS